MIFWNLFFTFFQIGLFTFGGGYAMIPLIQDKVLAHGWLTMAELVDFIAISESTPGPFAVNVATYVGAETAGVFGAFCATLGLVLPSFLIILLVARCYLRFKQSRIVSGALYGLRAAVVGLLASALFGMLPTVFFPNGLSWSVFITPEFLCSAGIFGGCLVLALKKISPIIIVLIAAAAGLACGILLL